EGGVITFAVIRTGDAQAAQTVNFATSIGGGDTASVNDFTTSAGTLTFNQGDTVKTFTVQTTQDALFEPNETFTATLSAPNFGTLTTASAAGTINNDDAVPSFAVANASATEGGIITFTVTRTGDAQATQTVQFATSDGTATVAGPDYTANSGTLTFN